ncbi:MAG: glycosyl hydrolase family 95 catalytic domain-containing protein [Planctomycetota bacterium]|jgi:alpha-L-fucosidase 2
MSQENLKEIVLNHTANSFEDGFPVGNGEIGVMFYGGPGRMCFVVNHNRLWHSPKVKTSKAKGEWAKIRRLADKKEWVKATEIATNIFRTFNKTESGEYFGSFQPGAYFEIWPELKDGAFEFERRLDFETGAASYYFQSCGYDYTVTCWPDANGASANIKLETNNPEGWKARVRLYRPADGKVVKDFCKADKNRLSYNFTLNEKTNAEVSVSGKNCFDEKLTQIDSHNKIANTPYYIDVQSTNHPDLFAHPDIESALKKGRKKIDFKVAIATGKKEKADTAKLLKSAPRKLKSKTDSTKYLSKAKINLPGSKDDLDSPAHYQHLWETGRYLFAASCTPEGMPPNLQGIWNQKIKPVCNSDYHMDLNLEMNFWHALTGNLVELNESLILFIESMVKGARKNARDIYNMRGVCFPGTSYGQGEGLRHCDIYIGISGWLMSHLHQHWRYTLDDKFLKERYAPILKEVCLFYLDYLQEKDGRLIVSPSISPENRIPERKNSQLGINSTFDLSVVKTSFENYLTVCCHLKNDKDKTAAEVKEALPKLSPYSVNKEGALRELEDYEWHKGHRHPSHIHPLFPGEEAVPEDKELFTAAVKSLERFCSFSPTGQPEWMEKVGYGTWAGWTYVFLALLWARAGDGEKALYYFKRYSHAFRTDGGIGLCFGIDDLGFGLTFSNQHGKWIQVDAAMGSSAALQEMLLQSHGGVIRLLPALPKKWKMGSFEGLRTEGNFEISLSWKNGKVKTAEIKSNKGAECQLKLPDNRKYTIKEKGGKKVELNKLKNKIVSFKTTRGKKYIIKAVRT